MDWKQVERQRVEQVEKVERQRQRQRVERVQQVEWQRGVEPERSVAEPELVPVPVPEQVQESELEPEPELVPRAAAMSPAAAW